jgi:hypothetical protein
MQRLGLVGDCLQGDRVGDEFIVDDRLFLFGRAIGPQAARAAEIQVLRELVAALDLRGALVHAAAQLLVTGPAQQERGCFGC